MKLKTLAASLAFLGAASAAQAATLTGLLNVDNAFDIYISTNDSQLGTLFGSSWYDITYPWMPGYVQRTYYDWSATQTVSTTNLVAGTTNYIHVVAKNEGGPGGFLGTFSLSGTGFTFANGGTTLYTNTTDWLTSPGNASSVNWSNAGMIAPTSGGTNGAAPWNYISGQSANPQWIWNVSPQADSGTGYVYFSAAIQSEVPEPGSLSLALAAAGLLALKARRKR